MMGGQLAVNSIVGQAPDFHSPSPHSYISKHLEAAENNESAPELVSKQEMLWPDLRI